jgi:glutamyl-tRNA reductase
MVVSSTVLAARHRGGRGGRGRHAPALGPPARPHRHRRAARHRPGCADVPGVTLYDIDDLQAVVARNLDVREGDRDRAEAIVEDEIQRFARWLAQMDVRPTVAELREHGRPIVDHVLSENAGRWESASPKDLAASTRSPAR